MNELKELVDRILEDKKITAEEADQLKAALLSGGNITEEGYEQIERILKLFDEGKITEIE